MQGPENQEKTNIEKNAKSVFAGFALVAPRTVFCMVFLPEAQTKNATRQLALHFWRLSLGNSYTLVKTMCARATSGRAGSEARGENRERGYFG